MGEGPKAPESEGARGFCYRGKTLLSGADPLGRANRAADAACAADGTLYLCPSPLLGHGLERLLARMEGCPNSALLCVEAEPELFSLALDSLPSGLKADPRLRVTDAVRAGEICALARREWESRVFRRVETVRLNGGWQLHRGLYGELERALQSEIAVGWGNAVTMARLGRRYMRNAMRNLALIPRNPSLGALCFGGAPVLALGAGPSLDGALDALSARFGEGARHSAGRPFRIVCADTCLPILKARGMAPDLAVVLESQHWNLGDFVGLSGWDAPAAMDLSALPRSGGVLAGGLCLFFTPWTRLRIFGRLGASGLLPAALPPLGSVGLSAVAIALRLTRGAVVAAGLDFSFSLDRFHARSSPGHGAALRGQNRFSGLLGARAAFGAAVSPAASKDGGMALTTPALRGYRDLFEREFASSPRLFDMAGGGLPLGVETLPREAAFGLLSAPSAGSERAFPRRLGEGESAALAEKLAAFAQAERGRLESLRDMLVGKAAIDGHALDALIDECDYLWAHFPDCAASGSRPQKAELETGCASAVSFLKRLRVEIDPFIGLLDGLAAQLPGRG